MSDNRIIRDLVTAVENRDGVTAKEILLGIPQEEIESTLKELKKSDPNHHIDVFASVNANQPSCETVKIAREIGGYQMTAIPVLEITVCSKK